MGPTEQATPSISTGTTHNLLFPHVPLLVRKEVPIAYFQNRVRPNGPGREWRSGAVSSPQSGMCSSSPSQLDLGLESPYPSLGTAVCAFPLLLASKSTELEPGPGWAVLTTPQLLVAVLRASNRNPPLYSHHLPALDSPAVKNLLPK